jgi:23S rRNA pseudouridine2605 synthase
MINNRKKHFSGFDPAKQKQTKSTADSLSKSDKSAQTEKKNRSLANPKITDSEDVRINKFIADAGVCSRREADKLIASGQIFVNEVAVTELGYKVKPTDIVRYNKKVLKRERFIYILLNKPKDVITTSSDEQGRRTVLDLIKDACNERVYPVGRLDRNTTGLLLLTNDGDLTTKLTHPKYNIAKTYLAEFEKGVTPEIIEQLRQGVTLEDGFVKVDSIEYGDDGYNHKKVILEIHSGKNRIVRRLFEHFEYEVKKLDRVAFAGIKKGNLTRGKWRFLEGKEVGFLKSAVGKNR